MLCAIKSTMPIHYCGLMPVPWEEASSGIITADDDGRITKFSEKTHAPRFQPASMGIYILNGALLAQEDALISNQLMTLAKTSPVLFEDGKRLYSIASRDSGVTWVFISSYHETSMICWGRSRRLISFTSDFPILSKLLPQGLPVRDRMGR